MKAWLTGDAPDLQDLADLLPSGDVRVVRVGDKFCLEAAELDCLPSVVHVDEVAQRLLIRINGLARTRLPNFRPVGLTGHYGDEGSVHVVARMAPMNIRLHMRTVLSTTAPQPPRAGPVHIALASRNADVAEALEIMGGPEPPNFAELYKVYEIIEATGTMKAAMSASGVSKASCSLFTRTANHQAASGKASRHARAAQEPPGNPMTIEEARAMIGRLLTAWMDLP